MKIITVIGENNTGKTSLIKYVFSTLKYLGAEVIFYKKTGAYFEDFYAMVIWAGKKIAIASIGDMSDASDKIDALDKTTESGKNVDDKLVYVQRGIVLAKEYVADILINVLSIPEKSNDKERKNKVDEYKQLLIDNGFSETFKDIDMEYIKPGDYNPIINNQNKCEEILSVICGTKVPFRKFCCCKDPYVNRSSRLNDFINLSIPEKKKKFYFPNFVTVFLIIGIAIIGVLAVCSIYKLDSASKNILILAIISIAVLFAGLIAAVIIYICKKGKKRETKLKVKLLSTALYDLEDFLAVPCNAYNGNLVDSCKEAFKAYANAIADI